MLKSGTIDQAMHDAGRDFQAAFIIARLDPLRALLILRVPGTGREPDLNNCQLHARCRVHKSLQALGGISSPAGSCVWHVVGLQRSVREWVIRQGWRGRQVEQTEARGILVAALGCWRRTPATAKLNGLLSLHSPERSSGLSAYDPGRVKTRRAGRWLERISLKQRRAQGNRAFPPTNCGYGGCPF
jgi:hypothetical protein